MKYGRATTDLHAKFNMHHQTNIAIKTNVCTSYSDTKAKQKYKCLSVRSLIVFSSSVHPLSPSSTIFNGRNVLGAKHPYSNGVFLQKTDGIVRYYLIELSWKWNGWQFCVAVGFLNAQFTCTHEMAPRVWSTKVRTLDSAQWVNVSIIMGSYHDIMAGWSVNLEPRRF